MSEKILSYKNKPFVRKGNEICYGNSTDKYVMLMMITDTKKVNDLDVSTKVFVQIVGTRKTEGEKMNVVKFGEFNSLYEAFDAGEYWLRKAISEG